MKKLLFMVVLLMLSVPFSLKACSVPVFRYALERWATEFYTAYIFTDKELSKEELKYIKKIKEETYTNIDIKVINKNSEKDKNLLDLYAKYAKDEDLPSISLFYPAGYYGSMRPPLWSGPFTKDALVRIVGSPAREKIVKNILRGDSAVWVLVESGDAKKDEKHKNDLSKILDDTLKVLELPEGVIAMDSEEIPMDPKDRLRSGIPLRLAFSVVSVSREEIKEDMFIKMLLNFENELQGQLDGTIAIPIIGQGRAIYPVMDDDINEDNIKDLCYYITGSCSCEVKSQNPGVDLIFAVSWYDVVDQTIGAEDIPPELGGLSEMPEILKKGQKSPSLKKEVEKNNIDKEAIEKVSYKKMRKNIVLVIFFIISSVSIISVFIINRK